MGIFSPFIYPLYKNGEIISIWGIFLIIVGFVILVITDINNNVTLIQALIRISVSAIFIVIGFYLLKVGEEVTKKRKEREDN